MDKVQKHNSFNTDSGAHPASYSMGTRRFSTGVKQPGREADHSPASSAEIKECVKLYLHSPSTPSRRGAQLKHRDNFTFYLYLMETGWGSVDWQISEKYRQFTMTSHFESSETHSSEESPHLI
jgi:hypothetical protein